MTTTEEYVFSIYNLTDKVDRIANAILNNYPFFNQTDKEAVKADAKSALWMKYERLHANVPDADNPDQFENACVRNAILDQCKLAVDKYYRDSWVMYYEWEWLKANFDRLYSGYTIGTYAYSLNQLTEGDPFSRVVVNGGDQTEYADFNEAFANLAEPYQRYLTEPEREDMGTHFRVTTNGRKYYSRALRKLHQEINNIAGSRMNKTQKREAREMEELHTEMLEHMDSIGGRLAKVNAELDTVAEQNEQLIIKAGVN